MHKTQDPRARTQDTRYKFRREPRRARSWIAGLTLLGLPHATACAEASDGPELSAGAADISLESPSLHVRDLGTPFAAEEHHYFGDLGDGPRAYAIETPLPVGGPTPAAISQQPSPEGPQGLEQTRGALAALKEARTGVNLVFQDPPFPWHEYRNRELQPNDLAALDKARADQIAEEVEPHLVALAEMHLQGRLVVATAPILTVSVDAAELERVVDAFHGRLVSVGLEHGDDGGKGTLGDYDGTETRTLTRASQFHASNWKGQAGNKWYSGNRVRVGIVEATHTECANNNWPNADHFGFKRGSGSRFVMYDCRGLNCSQVPNANVPNPYCPNLTTHAQRVSKVAAGTIENNEDPNPNISQAERIRRSGIATESNLYFFLVDWQSCNSLIAAANMAAALQIDVMNWSLQASQAIVTYAQAGANGACGVGPDCGGLNSILRTSTAAGVLHVAAMGNDGNTDLSTTCTARYPGLSQETIGVGALDNQSDLDPDFELRWRETANVGSSRGGANLRVNGTVREKARAVADISAPGCINAIYLGNNAYLDPNLGDYCGTSYATPAVTGTSALLRHAFGGLGWGTIDGRTLMLHALLMGDGYNGSSGASNLKSTNGVDSISGTGRAHFHFPQTAIGGTGSMAAPWGWGWHAFYLNAGGAPATFQVWGAPLPNGTTGWKLAMTWVEPDLMDAADIDVRLEQGCGGTKTEVLKSDGFDNRKRLRRVHSGTTPLVNECFQYVITPTHIPAGQSRLVYVADYFHGGDPNDH